MPASNPPIKKIVTAASLAVQLELSKATVTHVLNGRGTQQRIRQETQERVLKAAAEMGYRPNLSARAIRTGRFGCVALIQSLKGVYLPTQMLDGIVEELAAADMNLSISEAADYAIEEADYVPKVLRESMADGLLINRILEMPQALIERIHSLTVPAVLLNVKYPVDCVHPDELSGGQMAAEHLIKLGHTRIGYVQSGVHEREHFSEIDRRAGYVSAMLSAGLQPEFHPLPANPVTIEEIVMEKRVDAARAILANPNRPTAIIAYELAEAMALYHAANQLRLKVPGDLSLVVFQWGIDARLCVPFTTVTNAINRVGREAVKMLLERINDPSTPLPTRSISGDFMVGNTTSPPNSIK